MATQVTGFLHETVIVACARWETQYVMEWLIYHRSIGFDHVYLYCNDDDPGDLYVETLPLQEGRSPFVTFIHFPFQGQQFYMYRHFLESKKSEAKWIVFLDIDEFLRLPGVDNIKQYLATCPANWDAIHFNWNYFGNNGFKERPRESVLMSYIRRNETLSSTTKSIARSAVMDLNRINRKHSFWHDWSDMLQPGSVAVNVLGEPMERVITDPEYLSQEGVEARIREKAFVNHYAFKSKGDFEHRIKRGMLGDFSGQSIWRDTITNDGVEKLFLKLNETRDTYLRDYWSRFRNAAGLKSVVPSVIGPNIARAKSAFQSSISEFSNGINVKEDAKRAVSGQISGSYQCHTDFEDQPWWSVDLYMPYLVAEIRIYNRVDQPEYRLRIGRFRIDGSINGVDWNIFYVHVDGLVGGADGHPLILSPPKTKFAVARFLRLTALQPTWLHLDQVEVYGEAWTEISISKILPIDEPKAQGGKLEEVIELLNKQLG